MDTQIPSREANKQKLKSRKMESDGAVRKVT
jgi:hypothetical protein